MSRGSAPVADPAWPIVNLPVADEHPGSYMVSMANQPPHTRCDPATIEHYHAHIYYDPIVTRERAARLRERVAAAFPEARLGRWHDELVGPHLRSMYQIAFPASLLASFLPWLMLNREGLTILLHPETGNAYLDHSEHAAWLGGTLPLRLDVLEGRQAESVRS